MWIRYIALTDDSPIGKDAALYCDALVATGMPVRLMPARVAELQVDAGGRCQSVWGCHRGLLVTPMDGQFVNVVCSETADWARYYTEGVMNALLISDQSLGDPAVISKYELVYTSEGLMANRLSIVGVLPIRLRGGF